MTNTGRLRTTSDTAIEKIRPVPPASTPASIACRGPWVVAKMGPYFVVVLVWGPATHCGLRLVWPHFHSQRCPPYKLITGSKTGLVL